jgi:hypothetical protein
LKGIFFQGYICARDGKKLDAVGAVLQNILQTVAEHSTKRASRWLHHALAQGHIVLLSIIHNISNWVRQLTAKTVTNLLLSVGQRLRATRSFTGNNGGPEMLCFNEHDLIEILTVHAEIDGWLKVMRHFVDICNYCQI